MIAKITTETSTIVRVNLTDAPALPQGQPMHIGIEYTYEQTTGADGWTDHAWRGYNLSVGGENPDTGFHFHQTWTTLSGEELSTSDSRRNQDMPLWIRKLVDELRPSGDLSLPKIK